MLYSSKVSYVTSFSCKALKEVLSATSSKPFDPDFVTTREAILQVSNVVKLIIKIQSVYACKIDTYILFLVFAYTRLSSRRLCIIFSIVRILGRKVIISVCLWLSLRIQSKYATLLRPLQ